MDKSEKIIKFLENKKDKLDQEGLKLSIERKFNESNEISNLVTFLDEIIEEIKKIS